MIKDYFEIANYAPLLTFEKAMLDAPSVQVSHAYKNWPPKFAKMICAHFVPGEYETAVGAYLLRK
jgi:hypothetical protein